MMASGIFFAILFIYKERVRFCFSECRRDWKQKNTLVDSSPKPLVSGKTPLCLVLGVSH